MATTIVDDLLRDEPLGDAGVRARLGAATLRSALLLGLAGDLLLRGGGLGINALLYALLIAGTVWALDLERGDGATSARLPLLVPIVASGVALSWRGSELLSVAAVLLVVGFLALHAAALRAGPAWSLWHLDVTAPVRALLRLGADGMTQGALLLARDVPTAELAPARGWRTVAAGWRGLLVSVPIVLVLNALLIGADPVWARQTQRLVDVDLGWLIGHAVVTVVLAWLAGGWLRGALLAPAERAAPTRRDGGAVRAIDVLVPLVLVDVLFAGFVLTQLRTLAGGAEYVRAVAGLTFAEYARHGFFQLVLVALLTLPALLAADALTPLDHRARRSVRRASAATLVLLGGILASAAVRMGLYLEAYGLTEDRFYASVAMGWIAVVLAWFAATVLRDRRERFIGGAIASAWATWALLVVANPDAIIARTNLARLGTGPGRFDAGYVARLGKDAAPTLAPALARMTPDDACRVRAAMARDATQRAVEQEAGRLDWRAWSVAGWRAERAWRRAGATPAWAGRVCPSQAAARAEALRRGATAREAERAAVEAAEAAAPAPRQAAGEASPQATAR